VVTPRAPSRYNRRKDGIKLIRRLPAASANLGAIASSNRPVRPITGMADAVSESSKAEIVRPLTSTQSMTSQSRRTAGILLVILPTVIYGGTAILNLLIDDPRYQQNALRQDLWRAGHAHAGVLLILSLVALRYVDEANLSEGLKKLVRSTIPSSAILLPAAFFLSVLSPDAARPNQLISLAYVGAVILAIGLLVLGVGLLRKPPPGSADR
jgi:hypothetical protein